MFERGWAFVRQAGTLIVAVSIVVWAALYYPRHPEQVEAPFAAERATLNSQLAKLPAEGDQAQQISERLAAIDAHVAGEYRRQSFLGQAGHWIEPVVKPLGWDWRIGCAAIASFPAREVVIATLGIIYDLGENVDLANDADSTRLQTALRQARWAGTDRPVFNVPVALSIMVFFALCAQMRFDAGGHQARDQQLALAVVYVRLYDGAGIRRLIADVPDRPMVALGRSIPRDNP